MSTLKEIIETHDGKFIDKWSFYLDVYDSVLESRKDAPVDLLEIGVQNGGSLEVWAKYFTRARTIVGCDVNPACGTLAFSDSRIAVVVADASSEDGCAAAASYQPAYDIIIDDGSHTSRDIVRTFCLLVRHLKPGGVYIVEDLHCGYWSEYGGGLFHPYAAQRFFRLLADTLNSAAWGVQRDAAALFSGFEEQFSFDVDVSPFSLIHSVAFYRSMCVIQMRTGMQVPTDQRILRGTLVAVESRAMQQSKKFSAPDQADNPWATLTRPPEQLYETVTGALAHQFKVSAGLEEERQAALVQLTALTQELEGKVQEAKDLVGEIAALRQELLSSLSHNAKMEDALRSEKSLSDGLQYNLSQIRASTSWKITRPMRLVVRLMRAPRTTLRQIFHLGLRSSRFAQRVVGFLSGIRVRRTYALWLHKRHSLDADAKKALDALQRSTAPPRFSVVVPIYKSNLTWLREAINSVVTQSYPHWELCLVDDASCDAGLNVLLKDYTARDARIRSLVRSSNGHISAATNDGIYMATGDWVVLLDHDDRLHQHALLLLAEEIDAYPESALIYSDEDHLSKTGDRCLPFFKPDWSPHLALSQAYVGHLLCFRRSHKALLREAFDGAQDYDLWLRLSQGVDRNHVRHIPKVLYHWRMHEGSTAGNAESKRYAHESGKRAVQDAVDHRYAGFGVVVGDGPALFTYKLKIPIPKDTRVSIIIPTRDKLQFLAPCIESIRSRSSWQNFEILIVDNESSREDTRAYLQHLSSTDLRVRIISADIPFNWSRLNNLAAQQAQGDALIFLNNDTEILAPGWIESLVGFSRLPDVGCVGGLLLYPDHSIQHNGVVVGLGGWADHVYKGMTPVHAGGGPFVSPGLTRNVLAVTGACLAISKARFFACGMFDEEFQICGSDVELGIRLYKQGYFNVVVHDAQLLHHESKTRSNVVPEGDFIASAAKYAPYRVDRVDPFYNPNLSLFSTTPNLVRA